MAASMVDAVAAASPGFGLTLEEQAALEVEMAKRRAEERLADISFWGRITGTVADYLVVCGLVSVMEAPAKKFFFATTKALVLQQLPDLTEDFAKRAADTKGRFTGNPSRTYGDDDGGAGDDGGDVDADGNPVASKAVFSEAHRLAHTVHAIERETAVVPRGAFSATPTHEIIIDPLFRGLSATEAPSLAMYAHFRKAEGAGRKSALTKAAVLGAGDFLDPIAEDEHAALLWRLKWDASRGRVHLRSLAWPGYFFFHDAGTPRYGSVYVGDGLPNGDLPFMV